MAGGYTRADVARIEGKIVAKEAELEQTPEKEYWIKNEIENLKRELADAKSRCS